MKTIKTLMAAAAALTLSAFTTTSFAATAEDPGPAGFSGSIVIAEFESLEAARAWADEDPYVAAGVYAKVDVRPFKKVLP